MTFHRPAGRTGRGRRGCWAARTGGPRPRRCRPVPVGAETGRTEGLQGTLGGLSARLRWTRRPGAGRHHRRSPRRGRITTAPEVVNAADRAAARGDAGVAGEAITYRTPSTSPTTCAASCRWAQVVCLDFAARRTGVEGAGGRRWAGRLSRASSNTSRIGGMAVSPWRSGGRRPYQPPSASGRRRPRRSPSGTLPGRRK